MITAYIKNDLFATELEYIAHGCNCQGVMGSGVAKIVKEKYPTAFDEYKNKCDRELQYGTYQNRLTGTVQYVPQPDGKIIVNMFTQIKFGKTGKYVSYDAIYECFRAIEDNIKIAKLAIPRIGAGLGGGQWNIISTIIESVTPNTEIYVYDPEQKTDLIIPRIFENFNGA